MKARPVPQRIAGYEPGLITEPRRVPETLTVVEPPALPPVAFPPENPTPLPTNFFDPPQVVVPPPPITPPGLPPCDPTVDPDCPDDPAPPIPTDPPTELPEPGVLFVLIIGVGAALLLLRPRRPGPR